MPNGSDYPNSNLVKVGGCVVGNNHIAKIMYCPRCRELDPLFDPTQPELEWSPSPLMQEREALVRHLDASGIDYHDVYVETDGSCYVDMGGSETSDLSPLATLPISTIRLFEIFQPWQILSSLAFPSQEPR